MKFRRRNIRRRPEYRSDMIRIHRVFSYMRKIGLIQYKAKHKSLVPISTAETCTVCIICFKAVSLECHFRLKHTDKTSLEIQALETIGRCIANRLANPGSQDQYPVGKKNYEKTAEGTKNNKAKWMKLLNALSSMFGSNKAKNIKKPSQPVQYRDKLVHKANSFLKDHIKSRKRLFGRRMSVSLDQLEIGRCDLEKDRNIYCLLCGEWVEGRWIDHTRRKHKRLSRIQNEAIRLYSQRLKISMLQHILLKDQNALKAKDFDKQTEISNLQLDQKAKKEVPGGRKMFRSKPKSYSTVENDTVLPNNLVIRWKKLVSKWYEPIIIKILIVAYLRIKILFGHGWAGFACMNHYRYSTITRRMHNHFMRSNPPTKNSINFLILKTTDPKVCHINLAVYSPFRSSIDVYEGTPWTRKEPLTDTVKIALYRLYGHLRSSLKAGYVQGYSVQDETWTCGFRALFACIGVLAGADVCNFEIKLEETFRIVKLAVERDGKGLAGMTLQQIWSEIATPKVRNPDKLTKYEWLKGEQL